MTPFGLLMLWAVKRGWSHGTVMGFLLAALLVILLVGALIDRLLA